MNAGAPGPPLRYLVGTADGNIGVAAGHVHLYSACGMGEVPYHDRSDGMRALIDRFHVVLSAGAIIHLGDHDHSHLVGDGLHNFFRIGNAQLIAGILEAASDPRPYTGL